MFAVFLEELNLAMLGSRRCIVLITPNFTRSDHSKFEVEIAAEVMSSDMTRCIIPVLLGVSACVDSSPLFSSEPCLSRTSSSSTPGMSQSASSTTDDSSGDSKSSQIQSSSSGTDSSGQPAACFPKPLSKIVRINFNYNPLLGQFVKTLRPLRTQRRKSPPRMKDHTRFLKQLRLRMPRPRTGETVPPTKEAVTRQDQVVETVAHNDCLVDNEQLPDWSLGEDEFDLQELPRLCPGVPGAGLFNHEAAHV